MSSDDKVRQVLKTLSKSKTFLGKSRHEVLSDFGQWFFTKKPHFDEETMKLLLIGHGPNSEYPEGLFQLCGTIKETENNNANNNNSNTNVLSVGTLEYSRSLHDVIQGTNKRFKQFAVVALEILSELAVPTNFVLPPNTSQKFKLIVSNALDYDTLLKANLDLHLLSNLIIIALLSQIK